MGYKNPASLERVAVHESGHALVASMQTRLPGVRYVEVHLGGESHCQLESPRQALEAARNDSAQLREIFQSGMAIFAAGNVAEWIAFGDVVRRSGEVRVEGTDDWKLVHIAMRIRDLMIADRRTTKREIDRRAIEAVPRAFDVAEFWLRSRWGAVERVAEALLRCQHVSGEYLRLLIDSAPNQPKSLPTLEEEMALLKRAAIADPMIGRVILRAREAA